jgi:uncharacterized protein with ParB-like and HNH nuclease domain
MNALRYSLKQLLTAHRDRKFVVPNYQREYEWETPSEGKGEVGQFWDDIWHNCWKAGRKHFLGVILVDERGADWSWSMASSVSPLFSCWSWRYEIC